MKDAERSLAENRMLRAHEAFDDAELLLQHGSLVGAVNRFYYAAFYGASALLATRGLHSSRHSGVISLFQQHFVKTAVVPAEAARALPRSFERRQDSDYGDYITLTLEEVRSIKEEVGRFLKECRRVIDSL